MLSAVPTAAAASHPATAKRSHCSKTFSSQQSQRGNRRRACAALNFLTAKTIAQSILIRCSRAHSPRKPHKNIVSSLFPKGSTCMLRSGVTLRQTPLSGAVFQDLLRSHAVSSDIPYRAFSLRQGFVDCWLPVVFQL
jgi:hypothetical protein